MKIAIHNRPGSFSDRWIEYCEEKNIDHKLVNCYDNDIVNQLDDCDALMWHHHHADYKDVLFAKQLLFSLQQAGKIVFPDFHTAWHFDDKVGQKYLLESIGAPLVPSFVFYSKQDALNWAESTTFPKVFKLRGGAGSANVKLVKSKQEARRLIVKAFGKGFPQFDRFGYLKERISRYRTGKDNLAGIFKGVGRLFIPTNFSKMVSREKGYIYFQDFIPNNKFDVRLIVIGDKAYGMKRIVRNGDFRASGSEEFVHDEIDSKILKIAFQVAKSLRLVATAFDFIYSEDHKPLIVEISYGYGTKGSSKCHGYWDNHFEFHEGYFNAYGWMVENVLLEISKKQDDIL